MNNIKWIFGGAIILIFIGLIFYAGRSSKKCPECPQIVERDSVYIIPLPPQHAEIHLTVHGKPAKSVKDSILNVDSSSQIQTVIYSELIDTVITFQNDSLDFVAEITFDDSSKTFNNLFDFNLRVKKRIEEIWHEVPIPYKPEIWQNGFVILLEIMVAFLFGLIL